MAIGPQRASAPDRCATLDGQPEDLHRVRTPQVLARTGGNTDYVTHRSTLVPVTTNEEVRDDEQRRDLQALRVSRSDNATTVRARLPAADRAGSWELVLPLLGVDLVRSPGAGVGPGHPALVPVHGGLRRAHVPPRQRRGSLHVREVALEAQAGPAVGAVERSRQDQRSRSGLPPARPVGGHQLRRLPGMGAGSATVRRRIRRPVRLRRPRRDEDHPGGGRAGPAGGPSRPGPGRGQLLRRDRTGRLRHLEHRARHRLHQRPAPAGPQLLLSGHTTQAPGQPELRPTAGQRTQVPGGPFPAGRPHDHGESDHPGQLRAQLVAGRCGRSAGGSRPRVRQLPGRGVRAQAPAAGRKLRRPLQPGPPGLRQPDRRGATPPHRRVRVRARQMRAPRHPRPDGRRTVQRRRRSRAGGG